MDELDRHSCLDWAGTFDATEFGGDLRQQRAIAFATCQQVLRDLGKEGIFRGGGLEEPCLDSVDPRPYAIDRYEVADWGEIHYLTMVPAPRGRRTALCVANATLSIQYLT